MKKYIKILFFLSAVGILNTNVLYAQYAGGQGRGDVRRMSYITPSGANTLTIEDIVGPFCAGESFSVYFYNAGIYNNGNIYTLELSDANGNFTNPLNIGTLVSTNNVDTIQAILPTNLPTGSNYMLRLTSTNPSAIGLNSNTFTINELLNPSISISTNQTSSCQGTTLFFSSTIINGGLNPTYDWLVNGISTGVNNPNYSSFNLNNNDIISCLLTSSENCTFQATALSDSIVLNILPSLNTSVTISASDTSICSGSNVFFNTNAFNGGNNPVFQWYVNNTPTLISSTYNSSSINDGDTLYCIMTSSLNCVTPAVSNSIVMSVTPNNFGTSFDPSTTLLNTVPFLLSFSNVSPISALYNLTWSFGDGSTGSGATATHSYVSNGFFNVSLTATDTSTGCSQTYTYPTPIEVSGSSIGCNYPVTLNQNGAINGCVGGHVILEGTTTAPNATYQWTINGVNIGGATQSTYTAITSGNYALIVYANGNCPNISSIVPITFTNPYPAIPVITATGNLQSCGQGTVMLEASANGASSFLWNTGETTSQINTNQSGNYYVIATYSVGCQATSLNYSLNATGAINPGICMVSVDSATNKNVVIWEVPVVNNIDSFLVYRETNQANVYEKIGAVDYYDLSEFIDTGSYPQVRSYRYKLLVLDSCGGYTPLSDLHKTIHLQIYPGIGTSRQLSWTHYEGINVPTYEIYRKFPSDTVYQLLTTIAGNLNTYTDVNPIEPDADYRVEIILPQNCNSSDRAAYGKSKSNVGSNQGLLPDYSDVAIEEPSQNSNFIVYPNPSNGTITIEFASLKANALELKINNLIGEEIFNNKFQTILGKNMITLQPNLAQGVYLLEAFSDQQLQMQIKLFIK
ncbi:MAG TPA: PKD domain-containing protein [Bacteroidia bacterium]|nr:PKD domain-containing protein [Bacteroidia bacterium]